MAARVDTYIRKAITNAGWRSGTSLENRVIRWLHRAGFQPGDVVQQHRVGRYRVDFAWPSVSVVLEADGWHHRSPEGAAKDAERDSWLRSQGWLVFRVDDRHGEDSLDEQVVRVCRVVHMLRDRGA